MHDGHINISPKGYMEESFAIISPNCIAYADTTGSGAETIAHSRVDNRIVVMFMAFEGAPQILRLYGRTNVVLRSEAMMDPNLRCLFPDAFVESNGFRAVVMVNVDRVSTSCGWSVPFYNYVGERNVLKNYQNKMTREEIHGYRVKKNTYSIDGHPSLAHKVFDNEAPDTEVIKTGGYFWAYPVKRSGVMKVFLTATSAVTSYVPPFDAFFLDGRDLTMLGLGALGVFLFYNNERRR